VGAAAPLLALYGLASHATAWALACLALALTGATLPLLGVQARRARGWAFLAGGVFACLVMLLLVVDAWRAASRGPGAPGAAYQVPSSSRS
jgi:hypothetical protein